MKAEIEQADKKAAEAPKEPEYVTYTVKRGDTLSAIAKRNGISITELKSYNNLKRDQINIGQRLRIPKK